MASRYKAIVKVKEGQTWKFVKYRVDNLRKFTDFIEQRFESWAYMNVYGNKKTNKGEQLASYTRKHPPQTSTIV